MFSPLFQLARKLEVPGKSDSYINDDIRPLPPSRRTWTKTTFIWFWLATSINIGGLSASSSILSLGLTVGQTALSDLTGSCIIMIAMIANGVQGAKWHIPFAVGNRAGWGVRGSWFVIANRLILSICWYGVQSWWGGQVVKNLIGAIWPSFYRMKNHFPLDAHMETNDFIGFIIFWTISLPLLAVNPERYRIPAVISSIAVTLGVLALMIWIIIKQGDGGPLLYTTEKVTGIKPLKGAALAWAFIRAVGTTVGAWGGGILYASDFSRYAVQPGDQIYGQAFVGPFCLIIGSFIGLIITSCAAGLYPDQPLLWRPYKLIEAIQTNEGTPGARAALFFLALTFLFSQWAVNISGCAITGGIDLSAMFPRYINTLRGPFVIAVIGFAITPWNLVNTANTFISVLGSYSTFLGPLAGIMITDYLVVRRQRVRLTHLYMAHPSSIYWFWHGINLKAVIVWVLSVGPSFPGFISVISRGKIKVPLGLVRTSYIGWMLGFAIASTLWTIINLIWPPPGLGEVDEVDVFGTFTEQINSGSGVSEKELDEGVSEKQAVEREVGHTLYI